MNTDTVRQLTKTRSNAINVAAVMTVNTNLVELKVYMMVYKKATSAGRTYRLNTTYGGHYRSRQHTVCLAAIASFTSLAVKLQCH